MATRAHSLAVDYSYPSRHALLGEELVEVSDFEEVYQA